MKKIAIIICTFVIVFILTGCDLEEEFSFVGDDLSIIVYKNMKFKSIENFFLENANEKIGKIKLDNKTYGIFKHKKDVEFKYIVIKSTSIFNNKNFCIYVNEKYNVPSLSNIENYIIKYDGKEYDYDILKYYYIDSGIDELKSPYTQIDVILDIYELDFVNYRLSVYLKDSNYYILNYKHNYVKIN